MYGTAGELITALRRHALIDQELLAGLAALEKSYPEPRALARELMRRGWLTAYQANQVLQGKAADLVLGSYSLLERLGEGGMGAVYKARHRTMDRVVALKVIRKDKLGSESAVKRFRREVQAAAQLNHPNVVRAFDADQAGGAHFLVMEYVEGQDLARVVKERGPLPIAEACDCIRQAALGLDHAHRHGMVHRDIKPANLLLASRDRPGAAATTLPDGRGTPGVIKILDMGLARFNMTEEDGESSSTLTKDGAVVGTPDYIAPEQALQSHTVDIRADLYSLGCSLYFLLTGRVPFPGGSMTEKLLKHQLHPPVPVEQLRSDVGPELAAIVRQLMAKKPEDRIQTPAQLAAILAKLAARDQQRPEASRVQAPVAQPTSSPALALTPDPEPSTVTAPVKRRRQQQEADRRRWLLYNAAGAGVLLVAGVVLVLLLGRSGARPAASQPAAVLPPPVIKPSAVPDPQPPPGFFALFNGRDLDGWKATGQFADWSVEQGIIKVTAGGHSWLQTIRSFRDFVLHAECRLGQDSNSGIRLRAAGPFVEVEMASQFNARPAGTLIGPALAWEIRPKRNEQRLPGEWNRFVITCRGDRITVVLNDVPVVDADARQQPALGQMARSGPIALQYLAGQVEYRNIFIQDLQDVPGPASRLDLLPLINPALDRVAGTWIVNRAGELLSDGTNYARIEIPYRPPAEYDLRSVFTRHGGAHALTHVIVAGGRQFQCGLGGFNNTRSYFEQVNGQSGSVNRTSSYKEAWLHLNKRHELLLQVRKDGVQAFLDGMLATALQSNFTDVNISPFWVLRDPAVLAVGSYASPTTFHRTEIIEISGPGTFTRPDDPAAKKALEQRAATAPAASPP